MSGGTTRAALAVENRMFRALAVLRVVVLAYTLAVSVYRNNYDRPALGWACVAVMVVATFAFVVAYAAPERRSPALLGLDLGLAVGLLVITPIAKGEWFHATVPGYWIIGALLAWAARWGWRGGTVAGAVLGAVDLLLRAEVHEKDWGNVFLLLLGGSMVGFVCESLKEMAAQRDEAQREAAAAAERARLARVVHDGVLQVLALVQRRGGELGGEAAEPGPARGGAGAGAAHADPLPGRGQHAGDRCERRPRCGARHAGHAARRRGGPARRRGRACPRRPWRSLVAVVRACLDNVERHVGAGAPAWVLVEDLGDTIEVSVRDDGPGIPAGRLESAAAEGRLGVAESIRGRVRDLGGTASLDSGGYGTEWTFTVPRVVR
nr:DUF5931 domain-containing protein [Nocardioides convexus]